MSNECRGCFRQLNDSFLCPECQTDLRELLVGLAVGWRVDNDHRTYQTAGYLSYLEDAVHGQTRLGESARRSTEHSTPLMVNLTASELLDHTTETLMRWVQAINTNTEQLGMEN